VVKKKSLLEDWLTNRNASGNVGEISKGKKQKQNFIWKLSEHCEVTLKKKSDGGGIPMTEGKKDVCSQTEPSSKALR